MSSTQKNQTILKDIKAARTEYEELVINQEKEAVAYVRGKIIEKTNDFFARHPYLIWFKPLVLSVKLNMIDARERMTARP